MFAFGIPSPRDQRHTGICPGFAARPDCAVHAGCPLFRPSDFFVVFLAYILHGSRLRFDPSLASQPKFFFFFFAHFYFPSSGQAVVTGIVPSPPRFLPSIIIAHRVQQYHCSSIFHRVLLTHALALSASQFVRKKKSPRIYTSMHSGGFELTKLTYTRLEDNLIRHRGDRQQWFILVRCSLVWN